MEAGVLTLLCAIKAGDKVDVTISTTTTRYLVEGTDYYYFDNNGTIVETDAKPVTETIMNADGTMSTTITYASGATHTNVGTINYGTVRANPYNNTSINGVNNQPPVGYGADLSAIDGYVEFTTLTNLTANVTTCDVEYIYNNEYVPQNDIPLLNVRMKSIALEAKARRIAIYFSQIAAFQA